MKKKTIAFVYKRLNWISFTLTSDRLLIIKFGYWTTFEKSQNKHCGFKLHHEFCWWIKSKFCPIICWSISILYLSSIASLTGQSEAISDCRGNGGHIAEYCQDCGKVNNTDRTLPLCLPLQEVTQLLTSFFYKTS